MSRFIGKRVFYPCHNCGRHFTLSAKTIEIEDGVLCVSCSDKHREVEAIFAKNVKSQNGGSRASGTK